MNFILFILCGFIRSTLIREWASAEKFRARRIDAFFRKPNEKDDEQEEEKGAGEKEKKFAANGVSLMNAFFVSGKQPRSGTHPAWKLCREINKFRTFAKEKNQSNSCTFLRNNSVSIECFFRPPSQIDATSSDTEVPMKEKE